jgi:trehalose 6-phosphate synthase
MNRLVVVSNRVPVPSCGAQAGGLAVALDGLMTKRGGLWFGWSGAVVGQPAGAARIEREGEIEYATLDLSQEEYDRYYNNFSNGVLWPLLHTLPELMQFERRDAKVYRDVNARMAEALEPLLRPTDLIWVHDYHLLPMPAALRVRGVHNPIGFFLHIPFASPDVLAQAPETGPLVWDLLSADLIGFQTDNDMTNFAAAAELVAGAVRLSGDVLQVSGPGGIRRVQLGVFPAEIEGRAFAAMADEMCRARDAQRLHESINGQRLILGVDRLDPTKGLLQRVAGVRRLLEKHGEWRRRVTFLQIAAISRKEVQSYRTLRAALQSEAGSLNADLGDPDWQPLRLHGRGCDRATVAGYMRLARVGLVTPLRDGMNLVAKEFVAAQDPQDPGVLILSRLAGAAHQLDAALLVNPHDPDAMADALDIALRMDLAERQARWRALWAAIEDRSPLAWGRSFVSALRATEVTPVVVADAPVHAAAASVLAAVEYLAARRTPPHIAAGERVSSDLERRAGASKRPEHARVN